jgi:hypothetical protein
VTIELILITSYGLADQLYEIVSLAPRLACERRVNGE